MAARIPAEDRVQTLKALFATLVLLAPAFGQSRFDRFERDVADIGSTLNISNISAAITENGDTVWSRNGLESAQPASETFSQTFSGEPIVWSFSQTGDSSGLWIEVPGRALKLTLSANSKKLTESAYLKDGNIARSTIALAFFEDVVFKQTFPREEIENRALMAFYLGRRDQSAAILREAFNKFSELDSSDDLSLLHLVAELNLQATESVATVVLMKHPDLPAAWLYYGKYLRSQRRFREATICFKQITEHRPPFQHWSVAEANQELSTLE